MSRRKFPKLREKFPVVKGPDGAPLCRYCHMPVEKPRICWCSDVCVRKAIEETEWRFIRLKVWRRDKGHCQLCYVSLKKLERVLWAVPEPERVLLGELVPWLQSSIARMMTGSSLWECDHILPIAEGGGHELSNLRVLCIECHKRETHALTKRLARKRKDD